MFSKLFSKKANVEKELNEKVKKLELKLKESEIELKRLQLKEKVGKFSGVKLEEKEPVKKVIEPIKVVEVQQFNPKQVEIFEKNLRDLKNENQTLKIEILNLKNRTEDSLLPMEKHRYRISLEKFYSGTKFNEILEEFQELKLNFVDELCEEKFKKIGKELKNYSEARKQYLDLKEGKISFDTKTQALKGERISKVFHKNRKFYTYMNENYLEFMSEISEYNFQELSKEGFKPELIEELIEKKFQYEKEFKI